MEKISETIHNIDGFLTSEGNGNENSQLAFNQI